jgi:hypothetical protein
VADLVILGGGAIARRCADLLSASGHTVRRSFEVDAHDRSPILIGEMPGAFSLARQAISDGRHVLLASAASLRPERLGPLFESRRRNQTLFIWSERRYHPAYRFVTSLAETAATWRPRYIRMESLTRETAASSSFRWLTAESVALVLRLVSGPPLHVWATAPAGRPAAGPDLLTATVSFADLQAHLLTAAGEALERRETLLAAAHRKAYVDEMNDAMPVRLIEADGERARAPSRWLAYPFAGPDELVRQQCLAFLEAAGQAEASAAEAVLWRRCLGTLAAIERSLTLAAPVEVELKDEEPRLRLLEGEGLRRTPPSVA